MMSKVSDFIPGSLEDTDKHIEFADGHHFTAKQKGQVRMKMCNNNGDPFIPTLSCSSPRWDNLPSGHKRYPLLGLN